MGRRIYIGDCRGYGMTTTAIEGGWVITGDPDEPWIEGGHVTVVDGLIESVGRGNAQGRADRTIDAGGMLVSPGFVNGHTHLCMSLGRSLGTDASLLEWLSDAQLPLMAT